MDGLGVPILLVFLLILLNAVFTGSEMAVISLREAQVQRLERESRTGRIVARLTRDSNRFLSTIQIGITLGGMLASAVVAIYLAPSVEAWFGFLGSWARSTSTVLTTTVLTFVTLVLGELAPKRIAMQKAEGWALLMARPLDLLAQISRPAVWLLGRSTDGVVRLAGVDPHVQRDEVTPEEIRDMVAAQQEFSAEQRSIISGAFEIADRILREILVPRRDVLSLPSGRPAAEALRALIDGGHSRAPVIGPAGLDDVIGVVHLRDLVGAAGPVDEVARPPLFLPETLRVSDALKQLRAERQPLALVVDERGAIDGIVTIEDLVEEIVGEIYDETDRDVAATVREPDGALLMPGSFPVHDLPDVGFQGHHQEEGDYTTIAGMVLARLGHIPTGPGEVVTLPEFTAEVTEVTGRAITEVRVRALPEDTD
ncbi:hemolysin family protein [Actinoplanes xinjiangensis]|jgi:putative hemolysin|uniref:Putative hemolysin n=1 Tax=Actinoplanes xinjiangensis TaxID=512350 RepID=A0A316FVJ4_9ACTN|nr:hemolysin family protein [Actinoplanes xinjiangensis]PWK51620.1 putative hemolysin [Actinoplanes xinjiangensis]GIF35980.1 membrane protein [Actinoplanes xinjiangensis]